MAKWVFEDQLGLQASTELGTGQEVVLSRDSKVLSFPAQAAALFGDLQSGKRQLDPTRRLGAAFSPFLTQADLPVLSDSEPDLTTAEDSLRLNFDPLALPAIILSGIEETLTVDRDTHDRFAARQSLAFREGWLDRPVVDEAVNLLRNLINHLWPGTISPPARGDMQVSCDVDQPFSPDLRKPLAWARSVGGDIINRKDPGLAIRRALNGCLAPLGIGHLDSANTFDRYMKVLETAGQHGEFYIISGHSGGAIDGSYCLREPRIRNLLARLANRGHRLGLHGSYNTFRDLRQISEERANLLNTLEQIGVSTDVHGQGNRQHYLRWDMAQTPDHLEAAGFAYDTSGSFPDAAGFRYGTAHAFPMWSFAEGRELKLQQRPLIAMECSVIAPKYMGLGYTEEAYSAFETLQDRAMAYGGTFTLLWHNSHFVSAQDWALFEHLVNRA